MGVSTDDSQTTPWNLTVKAAFEAELLAAHQDRKYLESKFQLLAYDPYPDGSIKKALPGTSNPELYMLSARDYIIFYTIQWPYVGLLALRLRRAFSNPTGLPTPEELAQLFGETHASFRWERVNHGSVSLSSEQQPLPRKLTSDFLYAQRIPSQYHGALSQVSTREELLNFAILAPEALNRLDQALFPQPLAQVLQQPTYRVSLPANPHSSDPINLTHLLLLAPEQERAVTWASTSTGPVQVKGKPGTGKSTVLLYRIRAFIDKYQEMRQNNPRVLFTTYTNSLVRSSEQLLTNLLETQARYVEVMTADKLITDFAGRNPVIPQGDSTFNELLRRALRQAIPEDTKRQKFLVKCSEEYLLEEIDKLIIAQGIATETAYLSFERIGRKVALREAERKIIWSIYELFKASLKARRQETWSQRRVRAEDILSQQSHIALYDAVFVDEAQDLEPSVLRILFKLCKTPDRFFITADGNQSIYNKGFSWTKIHEDLKFQGRRTITLKTNYRSTRQIGEAAESYLRAGDDEIDNDEWSHANSGAKPGMRKTADFEEEIQLLKAFLNEVPYSLHVGLQSCAILCPSRPIGDSLVQSLKREGIEAVFQEKKEVDLTSPGVKILKLHSSKGLEFPVVALAGFRKSQFTPVKETVADAERDERLAQQRKVLFVGMTRAMKALLVLVPSEVDSPLFRGFDPDYWNLDE